MEPAELIQREATAVLLEVELNPNKVSQFEQTYRNITGESPEPGPHYQTQPNKWGIECRIYFRGPKSLAKSLRDAGYTVEESDRGYRGNYRYRLNKMDLMIEMFRLGYRLGGQDPHKQRKLF